MPSPDGENNNLPNFSSQKDRAMLDFGLQGKAELSQIVVVVTFGIFGVLALFSTGPSQLEWVVLSLAYWGLFFLGIWAYGNHQMFATITDVYVKKFNPNFEKDLSEVVKQNDIANWMHKTFWKNAPYPRQRRRVILSMAAYSIIAASLYLTVAFRDYHWWSRLAESLPK